MEDHRDFEDLRAYLPMRSPMLLPEEIIELEPGERAVTTRRLEADSWFVQGHFPNDPILPATTAVEAIAQTIGVACVSALDPKERRGLRLGAIREARFEREIRPEALLTIEGVIDRFVGSVGMGEGELRVGEEPAARAKISFAVKGRDANLEEAD